MTRIERIGADKAQKIKIRGNPCHPRNPCLKAFFFDAVRWSFFNAWEFFKAFNLLRLSFYTILQI